MHYTTQYFTTSGGKEWVVMLTASPNVSSKCIPYISGVFSSQELKLLVRPHQGMHHQIKIARSQRAVSKDIFAIDQFSVTSSGEMIFYCGRTAWGHSKMEKYFSWWRHQMDTFSALPALCERKPPFTGGFPSQRPVTRSFDVFFDLRLNKRLSKQSKRRWFETPSRSLLRYCNVDPDGDPSPLEHLFLVWFRTHPENFIEIC